MCVVACLLPSIVYSQCSDKCRTRALEIEIRFVFRSNKPLLCNTWSLLSWFASLLDMWSSLVGRLLDLYPKAVVSKSFDEHGAMVTNLGNLKWEPHLVSSHLVSNIFGLTWPSIVLATWSFETMSKTQISSYEICSYLASIITWKKNTLQLEGSS